MCIRDSNRSPAITEELKACVLDSVLEIVVLRLFINLFLWITRNQLFSCTSWKSSIEAEDNLEVSF